MALKPVAFSSETSLDDPTAAERFFAHDDMTMHGATDAERHQARTCNMTVVAEADASLHLDGQVRELLKETYGYDGSYDLLSVPNLGLLTSQREHAHLLADDVVTTIDLHQVERVLVVARSIQAPHVIQRLREAQPVLLRRVQMAGSNLPSLRREAAAPTLVISCMDWRLHRHDRLGAAVRETFGVGRFELMATAGAAKELHVGTRFSMTLRQISELRSNGLKRIILLSHTDCGKYGGDTAFTSYDHQLHRLRDDLASSVSALSSHFPDLDVHVGYVKIRGRAFKGISPA